MLQPKIKKTCMYCEKTVKSANRCSAHWSKWKRETNPEVYGRKKKEPQDRTYSRTDYEALWLFVKKELNL